MRPKVEIKYPDGNVETVTLTRERTIIGRSPNADIRVNDNRVSREHCQLEVDGERIYVTDLGGSNGTWVGSAKLLANVREPFPQEAILHVGPAQLQNVTARRDPGNDLESQAFMPAVPARSSSGGTPSPRQQPGSAATIDLEQGNLSLNPGERGSLLLHISNQSKIVDHYSLSVSGVPNTWVTTPRAGIELLPRESGTLNIDLHPPRNTRTSAGRHPLSVALLNRQKQVVSETTAQLEIGAFDNMSLDVRPNPYESRSGGELTLTVENQGNTQTDYRVSVVEPSDALIITVDPPMSQVAPQQSRQSTIRLKPRKRHWIGQPKRMPLTVTVTSNLQTVSAMPVYTQLSMIPTWLPIIFAMACCVLVPLFSLMALNPIRDEYNTRNTASAATAVAPMTFAAATLTAQPTDTPAPDFGATATFEWRAGDCGGDGMTNGEKLDLGLDPCRNDFDGDGLSDYEEIYRWGTDPKLADTSGDGMTDGDTVWYKENGEPKEWYACLDPRFPDANRDGTTNYVHILNGTNPCAGAPPTPTPAPTPHRGFALGGQVMNRPDNLPVMQQAGMTWVKVQLRYSPGANVESTVRDFEAYKGFKLLISLVGHKEDIVNGGPAYFQEFANFAAQLAFVADAIEIWNEPNILHEWPEGQISPQMYTQLLQASYTAIKSRNQTTIVISGGPSPTGVHDGTTVWSDDRFIQGMVAAGARNYMDCVGVHFNAGATPPNETTGHPADQQGINHYSWYFMPMLNLYWDTFNPPGTAQEIPLCFTEIGFLTDEGFSPILAQTEARGFGWAQGTTVFNQAVWLSDALQRSCLSGKVKLFIVWNVDFTEIWGGRDPQGGYAIMRPNGSCPACNSLNEAMINLRVANCV